MKRAIKLIILYILLLTFGIALGVAFYSLYLNVQNFVAGSQLVIFQKKDIIQAFFYIAECALIIICPVLIYIRIRNKGGFLQFLAFLILTVITWGVGLPSLFHFESKYIYQNEIELNNLSGGFFRETQDKVYYFTSDFGVDNTVPTSTVIIDETAKGVVSIQDLEYSPDFILFRNSTPYRDIIIKNAFEEKKLPLFINFPLIIQNAKFAMANGWTFFLGFLSLGILLASLYGAASLYKWRLMNTCFLVFSTAAILIFNTIYFFPFFIQLRTKFIDGKSFFINLSNYVNDPLLVIINLFFSLLFVILGIVRFAKEKKNRR